MGNIKSFIPCIYLKDEKAVKGYHDDTVIDNDPVALSLKYFNDGADGIIVYDLSNSDETHDKALDCIKDICNMTPLCVIGAGNVKRMEDVKKLIYAGCKRAMLNYSKESNVELTKEVSLKFGKEKILACIKNIDEIAKNKEILKEYVSEIVMLDGNEINKAASISNLPMIVTLGDSSCDKITDLLSNETISAVTGSKLNDISCAIESIKNNCIEKGIKVYIFEPQIKWEELKLNSDGMIPVIVQDYKTNEVLMMAYMNEEAYIKTLKSCRMTYFSRSRNELWVKGETSGHYQFLKELSADCDKDTLLAKVQQIGAACHTGNYSCFFNEIMKIDYKETNPLKVFESVMDVINDRKIHPKEGSYTNYLFDKGIDKILKKVGEEATEIVIAAKNPNANEIKYEIADFLYHMMVLMAQKNVTWDEITEELDKR